MGLTTLIILVVLFCIGYFMVIMSEYSSIKSPIGMFMVTVVMVIMINPFFKAGDIHGYFMVVMAVFYLIMTVRAIQLYIRTNKTEENG